MISDACSISAGISELLSVTILTTIKSVVGCQTMRRKNSPGVRILIGNPEFLIVEVIKCLRSSVTKKVAPLLTAAART